MTIYSWKKMRLHFNDTDGENIYLVRYKMNNIT